MTEHQYQVNTVNGCYNVKSELHHDDDRWPHAVAVAIHRVISDDDLDRVRGGLTVVASVVSVGVGGASLVNQRVGAARQQRMEAMLKELLRRK